MDLDNEVTKLKMLEANYNIENNHLNRLSLVSFLDRIEVGEDNALNFVFNNIETVNLGTA